MLQTYIIYVYVTSYFLDFFVAIFISAPLRKIPSYVPDNGPPCFY
jgi:hypothetical protein